MADVFRSAAGGRLRRSRGRTGVHCSLVAAAALLAVSCGRSELPPPAPITATFSRPIGSWAGRGGFQTEFFYSDHGKFRVRWRARALSSTPRDLASAHGDTHRAVTPSADIASFARTTTTVNLDEVGPYFELKLQSGVSGRQLGHAVERRTSDSGVLEFDEDPRDFYFVVRANEMEWWFHVEERFDAPFVPSLSGHATRTPSR